MTDIEKIILDYLSKNQEPLFARQMIIKNPNPISCWDTFFSTQKISYYLKILVNKNKVEKISIPGDSYKYKIKK